jgi:hypothetical protein
MTVFWDVALCSLVEIGDISEVLIVSIFRVVMEAVSTSKTSVSFCEITWGNIPEEVIFIIQDVSSPHSNHECPVDFTLRKMQPGSFSLSTAQELQGVLVFKMYVSLYAFLWGLFGNSEEDL